MLWKLLPSSALRKAVTALILTSVEAFLAILCILTGLPILLDPHSLSPDSITTLLPPWALYGWSAGLLVGGLSALVGILFTEYRIERAGVILLVATTGTYSLALLPLLPTSFLSFLTFFFFSLAMVARYWVLGKLLKIRQMKIDYIKGEQENGRRS